VKQINRRPKQWQRTTEDAIPQSDVGINIKRELLGFILEDANNNNNSIYSY
jgi:hypothetical protein